MNELAAAALAAPQIKVTDYSSDIDLQLATYQIAVREQRTIYWAQVMGLGYAAYDRVEDIYAAAAPQRQAAGIDPTTPIAYSEFRGDGEIIEHTTAGGTKAPRASKVAGMTADFAKLAH